MKYNLDCIRDILIGVHDGQKEEAISHDDLKNLLEKYTNKTVISYIKDMSRANLLNADSHSISHLTLTAEGLDLYEDIKNYSNWCKLRKIISSTRVDSIGDIKNFISSLHIH